MLPWPTKRVTDLPPNAKLCEMQQNTHGPVQLTRAATQDVPYQTPRPQVTFHNKHGRGVRPFKGLGYMHNNTHKRRLARFPQ